MDYTREGGVDGKRVELVRDAFVDRFGAVPIRLSRAPGRVELLGTDTDDAEGYVLTMAIDKDTWVAYRPTETTGLIRLYSMNLNSAVEFLLSSGIEESPENSEDSVPPSLPAWARYVYGVASLLPKASPVSAGCDAVIHGTLPIGGGLSSSASLELAAFHMFQDICGTSIGPVEAALLCQKAEHQYAGVNCGMLDQYSSALGQEGAALLLDCRSLSHIDVALPAEIDVVVCDTRVSRSLADSQYGLWKEQCLDAARQLASSVPGIRTLRDVSLAQFNRYSTVIADEVVRARARFIVEENVRVLDMAAALCRDDRDAIARLTAKSFYGMRDLYGKTVREMESMFDAARSSPGYIGCRQSGGGFGGCLVAFVDSVQVREFVHHTEERYHASTGIDSALFSVHSSPGAGMVRNTHFRSSSSRAG